MINKIAILLSFGMLIIFSSCKHEPDLSSLRAVSYSNDIQPIIAGNCSMSGCHSDRSGSSGDDEDEIFPLTTYEEVIDNGEISPGNSHKSELYQAITNQSEELMPPPPRPALSDDQLKLIYVWIEQGALNN